ncbi:hypothetical protein K458DRAFT_167431 [Lentithecium fluviatile CBS 122367]|uniref:Uncharacterized protein n=1 Tax=Lentithecium fluviatile CBS 122367 TaxID=1168545 RepID=A0A6G1JBV8_9PLEO|nr:hypothetical protein K458DRAFT_167431 [Lentithecium fluviatile CBS 122367]
MAPKRGGGGGGSSSGSSSGVSVSCPYPFTDSVYSYDDYSWTLVAYFVLDCLFFVFTLIVLFSLCCVRKRHGNAKRLVGPIFLLSLLCALTGYGLKIIGTMLRECKTTDYYTYYDWSIAFGIFFYLANFLLLVVFVWGVNILLRERIGSGRGVYKAICLVILGVIGALTCGYIGLHSYNQWTVTPDGQDANVYGKGDDETKLAMAYYSLYMISVVASGVLSIVTIVSMRSKRMAIGSILGWVIALTFCMFFWTLLMVVEWSAVQEGATLNLTYTTYVALDYVISFFQLFSYIAILFLAKSSAWDLASPADTNSVVYPTTVYPPQPQPQPGYGQVPPPQQQYAYNGQPGQQYYYQAQPVYNGAPAPVNGNGQMVQVK